MKTKINRYDHGGARVWAEDDAGKRDLIVDIYEPEERREQIIAALIGAGIIPPVDLPRAVGLDWELSDKAKEHLAEIDKHIIR